jgi:hypothetical protein
MSAKTFRQTGQRGRARVERFASRLRSSKEATVLE